MITKEQFCKMIIKDYCEDNNVELSDNLILQSSTLAVCMEHLNLLKEDWAKEYAQSRGGIVYTFYDENKSEVAFLSTRELIDLLPDKID